MGLRGPFAVLNPHHPQKHNSHTRECRAPPTAYNNIKREGEREGEAEREREREWGRPKTPNFKPK